MGSESWLKEPPFESCYVISSSISNICDVGEWGVDKETSSQEIDEYSNILKLINEALETCQREKQIPIKCQMKYVGPQSRMLPQ